MSKILEQLQAMQAAVEAVTTAPLMAEKDNDPQNPEIYLWSGRDETTCGKIEGNAFLNHYPIMEQAVELVVLLPQVIAQLNRLERAVKMDLIEENELLHRKLAVIALALGQVDVRVVAKDER